MRTFNKAVRLTADAAINGLSCVTQRRCQEKQGTSGKMAINIEANNGRIISASNSCPYDLGLTCVGYHRLIVDGSGITPVE